MSLAGMTASPLGARLESPLGVFADAVASVETRRAVYALTSNQTLWAFDADDLSLLFGPLALDTSFTNATGLAVSDDGLRFFVVFNDETLAAFDATGAELWSVTDGGGGESLGPGVGFDGARVYTAFRHQTVNVGDTVTLQARDPLDGAVLATGLVYQDTADPKVARSRGLAYLDGALYTLVSEDVGTPVTTVTLYKHSASGLTEQASLEVDTAIQPAFDPAHLFVTRAPAPLVPADPPETLYVYVGLFDPTPEELTAFEAYNAATLAAVPGEDYTPNAGTASFWPPGVIATDASVAESLGPFFFESAAGPTVVKDRLDGTTVRTSQALDFGAQAFDTAHLTRDLGALSLDPVADAAIPVAAYAHQLTGAGTPDVWRLHQAPAGATVSATGLVEWASPVKAGSPHTFRAYAANAAGFDSEEWTVSVQDTAPVINAIANDAAIVGMLYVESPTLSAGDAPVTWSLDVAPAGASINPSTGQITWTPSAAGTVDWTVRASNAIGFDTESWQTTAIAL